MRDTKKLFFFVDDNITSNLSQAKEFLRALAPLGIRWVSQSSINAAHDEEFLDAAGAERLPGRAHRLRKPRPGRAGRDEQELQHDARRLRGRAGEPAAPSASRCTARSFSATTPTRRTASGDPWSSREEHRFYIAAFNHLTPFPGTPLYARLAAESRLLYERWWLDDRYRYNMVPFQPASMSAGTLAAPLPRGARGRSTAGRALPAAGSTPVNRSDFFMFRNSFRSTACCAWTRTAATAFRWGTKHGTDRCCARTEHGRRASPARRFDVRLASAADDAEVRRLLREHAVAGRRRADVRA